jgi:deoxyadenosine/deoxycytidine kinase
MPGKIIAVSGFMGSGKTTLAQGIVSLSGFAYLPMKSLATSFIPDVFVNPERWAFDAQISFLADKAIQVQRHLDQGFDVVIDRSIYEDVEIFAKYFYEHDWFDERSYRTYCDVVEYFLSRIPAPHVLIFCECGFEQALQRIKLRGRDYQKNYPSGYLHEIFTLYQAWIAQYKNSDIIKVNTEILNFRNSPNANTTITELFSFYAAQQSQRTQADLFDVNNAFTSTSDMGPAGVSCVIRENRSPITLDISSSRIKSWQERNKVYIAAPFTAHAKSVSVEKPREAQSSLFRQDVLHGVIPRGGYRDALSKLAKAWEQYGFTTLLPHRDINQWGKKHLTEKDVFEQCSSHVFSSNFFVGIIGQSPGAHYEYGIARGAKKPCVIIFCDQITPSFIINGVKADEQTCVVRYKRLSSLSQVVHEPDVIDFLQRNGLYKNQ